MKVFKKSTVFLMIVFFSCAVLYAADLSKLKNKIPKKSEKKTVESSAKISNGEGEGFVTKVKAKSYNEAASKKVQSVNDGDNVWLWVKVKGTVESNLAEWDFGGKDLKVLYFEIGPAADETTTYNTGFIIPKKEEYSGNTVVVNLAPGELAEMNLGAWMKTVGTGSAGKWDNIIRVFRLDNPKKNGTGKKILITSVPLTADVSNGAPKYKAMYTDYEKRWDAGDPSFNTTPEKGALTERALTPKILTYVTDRFSVKAEGFYFIVDSWYDEKDALGRMVEQHAFGVVYYQKNGKKYLKYVNVFRKANGQLNVMQRDNDRELTAENYKKGISLSK